jgi:hypothetical protein
LIDLNDLNDLMDGWMDRAGCRFGRSPVRIKSRAMVILWRGFFMAARPDSAQSPEGRLRF